MKIKKISNGYITYDQLGNEEFYKTLEDLFSHILLHYEGKSKWFRGSKYSIVKIFDKPSEKYTTPEEVELA